MLQAKQRRAREKGRAFDIEAAMNIPDVEPGEYLLQAMFVLGPTRATGMGEAATDYPVIESFARSTGRLEDGWDIETMQMMCAAFCSARQAGEDPFCEEPGKEKK